MAEYPPPSEISSIFNVNFYNYANNTTLTYALADARYLRLSGGIVTGPLTCNSNLYAGNLFTGNSLVSSWLNGSLPGIRVHPTDANINGRFDLIVKARANAPESGDNAIINLNDANCRIYNSYGNNTYFDSNVPINFNVGGTTGVVTISSTGLAINGSISYTDTTVSGRLYLANGSNSSPSATFTSSNTTGLFYNSSGLYLTAGGSNADGCFYVSNSGGSSGGAVIPYNRSLIFKRSDATIASIYSSVLSDNTWLFNNGSGNKGWDFVMNDSSTTSGLKIRKSTVSGVGTNAALSLTNGDSSTTYYRLDTANLQTAGFVGSASLPGYSFQGDPNTGMYNPAADQIAFSCGGTQTMLMTASALSISDQTTWTATSGYPHIQYNSANRLAFGETYVPPNETGTVVSFASGSSTRNMIFAVGKTSIRTSFFGNDGSAFVISNEATGPITFKNSANYNSTDILASGTTLLTLDSVATYSIPIVAQNGSAAAPAIRFSNGSTTGLYSLSSSAFAVSISGVLLQTWSTGSVVIAGSMQSNSLKVSSSGTSYSQIQSGTLAVSSVIGVGALVTASATISGFSGTPTYVSAIIDMPTTGGNQNWDRVLITWTRTSSNSTTLVFNLVNLAAAATSGTATIVWEARL